MQAAVIVLGDLGRSPRMQYHALALAVNGADVDLIGEVGTPLAARLDHPRIRIHRMKAHRGWMGVPGAALALFRALFRARRADVIVAQTPPAIPTLIVAWAVARLRGSRLILDWHNLGWTLLAVRYDAAHPLVVCASAIERVSGKLADGHLAVSDALAKRLRETWALAPVHVLRDRPAEAFGPRTLADPARAQLIRHAGLAAGAEPAIVISPTSWTSDEAIDLVLSAADALETLWRDDGPADGLLIVISGDGAGRQRFEQRRAARQARRVHVVTTWVSADEYPALVAAADAGLSLHRSSSRLDLPMKICDMFGAGLPVLALDYGPTLCELVTPERNTVLFNDARSLASCLDHLFRAWPIRTEALQQLQAGAAAAAAGPRWTEGWQLEARELIVGAEPAA